MICKDGVHAYAMKRLEGNNNTALRARNFARVMVHQAHRVALMKIFRELAAWQLQGGLAIGH
jgi:hypothetical protein